MSERRKWSIRSAKTAFETPWLKVRQYDAMAPTGVPATYSIVSFQNYAIGILPIYPDGTTILIGQERFAFGQYSWELPEGGGPMGRAPLESAKRELAEEARLGAKKWMCLFENIQVSNSITDERGFGYIAWDLYEDTGNRDPQEDLEIKRVPVKDVLEQCLSGEITDMFTVHILLHAAHLAKLGKLDEEIARAFL